LKQQARQIGVEGFLLKPVLPALLHEAILERFGKGLSKESPVEETTLTSLNGLSILLAEDNAINQQVAKEILIGIGARVDIANNGLEAVLMLERSRYDALLMDMQMPEMDGLTAARLIRTKPGCQTLPILALTAQTMTGDRELCLEAGMNDHISKPIDRKQLHATLLKWTKPHSENQVIPNEVKTHQEGSSNPLELAGMDIDSALNRLGGNKELLHLLLMQFQKDFHDAGRRLRSHLSGNRKDDQFAAQRFAHSIKGLAGNLSMGEVYETALAIEQSLKENDLSNLPTLLERFEAATERIMTAIAALDPDVIN
ncbi:MAG: response regulator, partial [Magnetococcales bacterium]|nr:response regulator [Magnetococcales bacterium]